MNQTLHHQIRTAVDSGFEALRHTQHSDGSFRGFARQSTGQSTPSATIFTTALVITACSAILEHPALATSKRHMNYAFLEAIQFIEQHQSTIGSWNYWLPDSLGEQLFPCPNDIDDTALALMAIKLVDSEWLGGSQTATLAKILTTIERAEGGPYNTWIVDYHTDPRWDDCDIAVNANVAYLLRSLGITLPNLETWFAEMIEQRTLNSKYYNSPITILYFISRSYTGPYHSEAINYLHELQQPDGTWGSPLYTALALTALHRFGEDSSIYHQALHYIIDTQVDGLWPQEDFYVEYQTVDDVWYHGSTSLSTAYCLEALGLALGNATVHTPHHSPRFVDEERAITEDLLLRAEGNTPAFIAALTEPVMKILQHPATRDATLAPYFFAESLGIDTTVYATALHDLSLGALAGWSGYTLIDDIMDSEKATNSLPQATFLLRTMLEFYKKYFTPDDYRLVEIILQQTDQAYYLEKSLALQPTSDGSSFIIDILPTPEQVPSMEKSLGHILPILGLLSTIDYPNKGVIRHDVVEFFTHYLKSRQINDDMHDIIEDLTAGRLTPINTAVLHAWKDHHPDHQTITISEEHTTLLKIFWDEIFPKTNNLLIDDLNHARAIAKKLPIPKPDFFINLVDTLLGLQHKAGTERQFMKEFLASY